MQIQVHSDNHIDGSARLAGWVSASITSQLQRFEEELTRVVVHLNDENGHKAGSHDKRCQIEARPKGLSPISVTHHAESLEFALDGAMEKLTHALEHQIGKLRQRRGAGHRGTLEGDNSSARDQLLEEDFMTRQLQRSA